MVDPDIYYEPGRTGPLQQLSVSFARKLRRAIKQFEDHRGVDRSSLTQMYRAGLSVGANVREAQFAESARDFVHKLKIAEKELAEFFYWFGVLLSEPPLLQREVFHDAEYDARQLRKLLRSIVLKMKERV